MYVIAFEFDSVRERLGERVYKTASSINIPHSRDADNIATCGVRYQHTNLSVPSQDLPSLLSIYEIAPSATPRRLYPFSNPIYLV